VVITTGSVQGSERMYWWLAQDLAERGYVVLTYDVQGQGRSETFPHQGDVADLPYCDLAAAPLAGEQTSCPGAPAQQTSNFVYGDRQLPRVHRAGPAEAGRAGARRAVGVRVHRHALLRQPRPVQLAGSHLAHPGAGPEPRGEDRLRRLEGRRGRLDGDRAPRL